MALLKCIQRRYDSIMETSILKITKGSNIFKSGTKIN